MYFYLFIKNKQRKLSAKIDLSICFVIFKPTLLKLKLKLGTSYLLDVMKKYNILLVEDNMGDVLLTREAFEECGFDNNLSVVHDGQEAINFLERISPFLEVELPDLILLDINLPKLNGHEVLKYIKSNNNYKHIPVIMLTTSSSENDIGSSYSNYANSYITKPTDVTDFFEIIDVVNKFWFKTARLIK